MLHRPLEITDLISHMECPLTHPRTCRLPTAPRRPYRSSGSLRGTPASCWALASRALEQQQANQVQRRLREARFPLVQTLETANLKKGPANREGEPNRMMKSGPFRVDKTTTLKYANMSRRICLSSYQDFFLMP